MACNNQREIKLLNLFIDYNQIFIILQSDLLHNFYKLRKTKLMNVA